MSLRKHDIIINISSKAQISRDTSNRFLNKFIELSIINAKHKLVKFSNFGSFEFRETPERLGRNPKTKESKIISSRDVVLFKPSKEFKDFINLKDNG